MAGTPPGRSHASSRTSSRTPSRSRRRRRRHAAARPWNPPRAEPGADGARTHAGRVRTRWAMPGDRPTLGPPTTCTWSVPSMTMTADDPAYAAARQFPWWLALIQGIALIVLGVLFFTAPGETTAALVVFLGFYLLIGGIMSLIGLL